MKSRIASAFLLTAALLAGAAPAWSKEAKQAVSLDRTTIVGTSVLPAGTYGIELGPGRETARFTTKGRTVAEVPCRVEFAEVVYPGVAVHYRTGGPGVDRLVKIVFADSNLAIQFPRDAAVEVDAPLANAVERP
jgi:hypothetical protein